MKFKVGDRVKITGVGIDSEDGIIGIVTLINTMSDYPIHAIFSRKGITSGQRRCREEDLSFADNEMQRLIRFQNKRRVRDELAAKT